jgi:hypothetical protein
VETALVALYGYFLVHHIVKTEIPAFGRESLC